MWFYIVLMVLVVALFVWVGRTKLFRYFLHHAKDPGQAGSGRSQLLN